MQLQQQQLLLMMMMMTTDEEVDGWDGEWWKKKGSREVVGLSRSVVDEVLNLNRWNSVEEDDEHSSCSNVLLGLSMSRRGNPW